MHSRLKCLKFDQVYKVSFHNGRIRISLLWSNEITAVFSNEIKRSPPKSLPSWKEQKGFPQPAATVQNTQRTTQRHRDQNKRPSI